MSTTPMNQPTRNVFNLKRFYNDELTSDLRLHIVEPNSSPLSTASSSSSHQALTNNNNNTTTTTPNEEAQLAPPQPLKTFHVHKLFLAARSEVFYKMFYGCAMRENVANPHNDSKMDIYFEHPLFVMELLLDYIYTNVCQIDGKTAIPLMSIADEFAVNDLKKLCARYVKEEVNFENCCDLLELSSLYYESDLCEQCALFIVDHANEIFKTDGFLNLSQEALIMLLQRQDLSVPEIEIFQAVYRWYMHKMKDQPPMATSGSSMQHSRSSPTITRMNKKAKHNSNSTTTATTHDSVDREDNNNDDDEEEDGMGTTTSTVATLTAGAANDSIGSNISSSSSSSTSRQTMMMVTGGDDDESSSGNQLDSTMNNNNDNGEDNLNHSSSVNSRRHNYFYPGSLSSQHMHNNTVDIEYVLSFVRLPLIKAHDLLTVVKPSGLVSQDKYTQLMEYKAYPLAFQKEQSTDISYQSRESKAQFRWANNHGSADFVLSNGGSSVEKVKNSGWNMVMMSDKAFTSGLNTWSISVDKINSDRSGMVIGVVSDPHHPSDGYKSCSGLGMSGYAYNVSKQVSAYGAKQGDHVHITVDFDRDVITFRLNDTVIGTSVKAPSMMKIVYACVFIYFESNKITAHFGM